MLATLAVGWKVAIIFVAGVAAGISNGIAGGGTFLSFPTLLALHIPTLQANISSSVGILPSTFGGIRGFRHELRDHQVLLRQLLPVCVTGSIVGAAFLLLGSPGTFRVVVPWLIGAATILFAAAPRLTNVLTKVEHEHQLVRRRSLFAGVFVASVYGGYFGAGLGLILLAILALTVPFELRDQQGLRVALALAINTVAGVVFVIRGHLALQAVFALLAGALVGGWLGTILILRLRPSIVRALVIAIGVVTTVKLAIGS